MKQKLTGLTLGRGLQRGTLIGVALVASLGCSDDGGTTVVPTDTDAGMDSGVSDTSSIGSTGSTSSSEVVNMTSETDTGDITVGVTTESSSTTPDSTASLPTLDSTALTSAQDTDAGTSGVDTSAATDVTVVDTSTGTIVDTTGIVDEAIDPPEDMIVIQNFDDVAGFPDGSDNVTVDRSYANSMMSLDIAFSANNQRAGVNFNYPGGAGELCGYDFVARVRMTSGTIDSGGLQLRVWSDAWGQFSSQITPVPSIGLGEWIEYRLTWEQAVANDDLGNGVLNIHAINAVGLEFLTFSESTALHFDVDWIGLRPSDTPCPSDGPSDAGTDASTTEVTTTDVTMPDVDGSVVDTSTPVDTSMPATSAPADVDASATSEATSAALDAGTF